MHEKIGSQHLEPQLRTVTVTPGNVRRPEELGFGKCEFRALCVGLSVCLNVNFKSLHSFHMNFVNLFI